jgi:hypothetical protein
MKVVKLCAQVRETFYKSVDGQPCTVKLNERKNFVKVSVQVRKTFCKSVDGKPYTVTLDELKNVVKARAR